MKSTQYSDKTLEHFRNPRNVGTLEGDDVAVGRVGNPVCGDLDGHLHPRQRRPHRGHQVPDVRLRLGRGHVASMVTELVMGKTLDEAMEVTRTLFLVPENDDFKPLCVTEEMDFHVWGVVTSVIHKV